MPTTRLFKSRITATIGSMTLAAAVLLGAPPGATAQTPSQAQQSAIRSACPDDYRSHCASVPPGGQAALACLQQNAAKLSDACRSAVQAVVGGAAAAPAANGAKTIAAPAPKPAPAAPAANAATPRQKAALVRQSCGADFRSLCRNVRPGGGAAIACLKANAASLSPRCQSALAPFAR